MPEHSQAGGVCACAIRTDAAPKMCVHTLTA